MSFSISYLKSDKTSHIYKVVNQEKGTWYQVRIDPSTNQVTNCSCPHSKYRSKVCKHQKAVSDFVTEINCTVSARDASIVSKLVKLYKDRIKRDSNIKRYLSMCLDIWNKHQTQLYIEDVKYKFDDSFTASELLYLKLGIEEEGE